MAAYDANAIPAAFGPNRMSEVWGKPPFERARHFAEALDWLDAGYWQGYVDAARAEELRAGVVNAIRATSADLARQFEAEGRWRERDFPLWPKNRKNTDDPDRIYGTGVMPPRIGCWPATEPYPDDPVELAEMAEELRVWMETVAARALYTHDERKAAVTGADGLFELAWRSLRGHPNVLE
ncbi:MAG TPA: hypothetical protein PLL78_09050 [Fimbriimonadaceae bacterium]|nr:hypothetical protein [Fimbriimonadaceae bacterium]HRJ96820.1 hypothetical protein [Fimbriimonadaceae bacterium]